MTILSPPPHRLPHHASAGDVLARSGPPCCPVCHDAGVIVEMRPWAFATHHGELANMPCPACHSEGSSHENF